MKLLSSWSGGKDCCFACYKAMSEGHKISGLLNFVSREFNRVSFHGIEPKLIQLQSIALGIPLLQKATTREGYDRTFREAVCNLKSSGIEGIVFGDIYSQKLKEWGEKVCSEIGIKVLEPLWGKEPGEIVSSFLDAGFEAIIVSAQSRVIAKEWVGCHLSMQFMDYLKEKKIGTDGEYHTLAIDGPIFQQRIEIADSAVVIRATPSKGNYWFLDARQFRLISKY